MNPDPRTPTLETIKRHAWKEIKWKGHRRLIWQPKTGNPEQGTQTQESRCEGCGMELRISQSGIRMQGALLTNHCDESLKPHR